jgi:hypothetical protein
VLGICLVLCDWVLCGSVWLVDGLLGLLLGPYGVEDNFFVNVCCCAWWMMVLLNFVLLV